MLAALRPDAALGAEAVAALRLATSARGLFARGGARTALPSAVAAAARQATDRQARARLCAVLAQEEAPWELKLRADTARARQLARGWRDDGACVPAALDAAAVRGGGGGVSAEYSGWELLDLIVAAHGVAPLRYRLPARGAVRVGALRCDAAADGATPDGGTDALTGAWVRLGGHGVQPHHATLEPHERGVAVLPVAGLLFANGEPVLQRTELIEGDVVVFGSERVLQLCRATGEAEAEARLLPHSSAAARRVAAAASLQGARSSPPLTLPLAAPSRSLLTPYHSLPPRQARARSCSSAPACGCTSCTATAARASTYAPPTGSRRGARPGGVRRAACSHS